MVWSFEALAIIRDRPILLHMGGRDPRKPCQSDDEALLHYTTMAVAIALAHAGIVARLVKCCFAFHQLLLSNCM